MYIAKYYNISYEKFFPTIDTSYANFKGKAKNTALTSDTIAIILSKYPEINITWILTGEGEMLLPNNPKIHNEDKSDNITLSREVFDLIKNQAEAILSQQKTIENLASKVKEPIVPQEGNAMNADAAGFSEK